MNKSRFGSLCLLLLLTMAAPGHAQDTDCETRIPHEKYGYDLLANCRGLRFGHYKTSNSPENYRSAFEPLAKAFDPERKAPATTRVFKALQEYEATYARARKNREDFEGLAVDFRQVRAALRRDGGWNLCPTAIWRECTVVALSVDYHSNRSMDSKPDNTFTVTATDQAALLAVLLEGITVKQLGKGLELDSLRERLKTYEGALAELDRAAARMDEIWKGELVQATDQFLDTVLPKAP